MGSSCFFNQRVVSKEQQVEFGQQYEEEDNNPYPPLETDASSSTIDVIMSR